MRLPKRAMLVKSNVGNDEQSDTETAAEHKSAGDAAAVIKDDSEKSEESEKIEEIALPTYDFKDADYEFYAKYCGEEEKAYLQEDELATHENLFIALHQRGGEKTKAKLKTIASNCFDDDSGIEIDILTECFGVVPVRYFFYQELNLDTKSVEEIEKLAERYLYYTPYINDDGYPYKRDLDWEFRVAEEGDFGYKPVAPAFRQKSAMRLRQLAMSIDPLKTAKLWMQRDVAAMSPWEAETLLKPLQKLAAESTDASAELLLAGLYWGGFVAPIDFTKAQQAFDSALK
ncbi:MAG: hypothetical protein WC966_01160 [Bradymonadales bacterium]